MKVAKTVDLKNSHHKKNILTVWWWMLPRLTVVIILQYVHILNHVVQLKHNDICQLYLNKKRIGRDIQRCLPSCKHRGKDMWGHSEKDHLQARRRSLTRNQPCWHFDLGLPVSFLLQNIEKINVCCLSHANCVIYFTAAWAN